MLIPNITHKNQIKTRDVIGTSATQWKMIGWKRSAENCHQRTRARNLLPCLGHLTSFWASFQVQKRLCNGLFVCRTVDHIIWLSGYSDEDEIIVIAAMIIAIVLGDTWYHATSVAGARPPPSKTRLLFTLNHIAQIINVDEKTEDGRSRWCIFLRVQWSEES